MHTVVLGLGGNEGDRLFLLNEAVNGLLQEMKLVRASAIYETEAWGGESLSPYLNQVLVLQTKMDPEETLACIQQIEGHLGRKRETKWGDRTMDIDILYFDEAVIHSEVLQVPHPQLSFRKFVLVPLAEVLPEYIHPLEKRSNKELLKRCKDPLTVGVYSDG
ncbi:2-amino-4-hydroxy-6-hydroxymethyldihydropteridine diphosphokinase [Cyclobacterium salsum]|uniref:2-amino-4-hydroxy-6- hydroxymethyldihydropteridine diphosphokinase n=1 Tax=Cyclobacterium salsum TaxID=2666329 RepID=UPI001391AE73|nr:2-amino-4-hydroxy-6-hydroxymethyldihydropteridine diphosphokinase [Cyclobacterium salsum]